MIFNISKIVLLASLNVISICASTGIEPDFKIIIKVPADLPDPRMDFNTALKNITNEEQLNHFEENKKDLLKLCEDTKQRITDECNTINAIADVTNLDSSVKEAALDIVEAEHEEWEIREIIINQIVISHDSFLNLNYRFIENLEAEAMKWLTLPAFDNCTTDLKSCLCLNNSEYRTMIKDIKAWLLVQQMINKQIPVEFIRPDWKPLLQHLNVPKERFMIASIKPEMNLYHLMTTTPGEDFENSIKKLKIKMYRLNFILKKLSEDFKNILSLLKKMFKIVVLAEPITLESINLRVKTFERLAESVVRSNQLNQPFDDHLSTILIKMWLLSRQMFTENGWNENMYGFIESKTIELKTTELESSLSDD